VHVLLNFRVVGIQQVINLPIGYIELSVLLYVGDDYMSQVLFVCEHEQVKGTLGDHRGSVKSVLICISQIHIQCLLLFVYVYIYN
jgi:hypothetical protein